MVPAVGQSQILARNQSHSVTKLFANLILVILVTLDYALTSNIFCLMGKAVVIYHRKDHSSDPV